MAFVRENNRFETARESRNESWKAQAFLNFSIPTKDGREASLGGLPLKETMKVQRAIMDLVRENPDAIHLIKDKLIVKMHFVDDESDARDFLDL